MAESVAVIPASNPSWAAATSPVSQPASGLPSLPAPSRPVRRTRSGDQPGEIPSRSCPRMGRRTWICAGRPWARQSACHATRPLRRPWSCFQYRYATRRTAPRNSATLHGSTAGLRIPAGILAACAGRPAKTPVVRPFSCLPLPVAVRVTAGHLLMRACLVGSMRQWGRPRDRGHLGFGTQALAR